MSNGRSLTQASQYKKTMWTGDLLSAPSRNSSSSPIHQAITFSCIHFFRFFINPVGLKEISYSTLCASLILGIPAMAFSRTHRRVYKPAEYVDLGPKSDEEYIRANVKAPRVAGLLVKIFAWILELRIIGAIVVYILKRDNLIHKLVSFAEFKEQPVFIPTHPCEGLKEQEIKVLQPNQSPIEQVKQAVDCLASCPETVVGNAELNFRRWKIQDFSKAYSLGKTTPLMVAEQFLHAVEESSSPHLKMSFFISQNPQDLLQQATESTLRYARGKPISILDGVPIAVKDEIDCMPYPTTGGTKWFHKFRPCIQDACCVQHLRSCGAILVGKTNMHELGAGTSGINPHYGVTRNPYNISKISGGSSSGSAAVVSAGLCPVALGVDGGGSVRMPAALCGVVGFKPSFGRVPSSGVLPLNWTVGMVGILAGTVEDAFIVYAALSGHLPSNESTSLPIRVNLPLLSRSPLLEVKLARYREWFNDCNEEVRNCCSQALDWLCKHYGWKIVEVTVPEIEEMRLAHYLTIGSESATSLASHLETLDMSELGWDTRVALSVYGSFSSREYLNAQRLRNRQMHFHKEIFRSADVIVTPTTGVTAYTIQNDSLKTGELDYINGAALIRYSISGNFLGLPAVTVPVGYDKEGLPVGLQFIGQPWAEATLLHIAYAVQVLYKGSYRKPQLFYDLLKED